MPCLWLDRAGREEFTPPCFRPLPHPAFGLDSRSQGIIEMTLKRKKIVAYMCRNHEIMDSSLLTLQINSSKCTKQSARVISASWSEYKTFGICIISVFLRCPFKIVRDIQLSCMQDIYKHITLALLLNWYYSKFCKR